MSILQLQRWGIVLCVPPTPDLNLVFCSRTSDYQSAFQFGKKRNTMNNVLSQSFNFWDSFFLVWFDVVVFTNWWSVVTLSRESLSSLSSFPIACAYFSRSLCHLLVTLSTISYSLLFTIISLLYHYLWSLIFDVISLSSWRPRWWLAGFWQWNIFKLRQT